MLQNCYIACDGGMQVQWSSGNVPVTCIGSCYSPSTTVHRVAVNSTHGQLDTCVELTHLQKSQLDTGVNSTQGQLDT